MNTITFSDFEATLINRSSLISGVGYNVEIKKEDADWGIMAVASFGMEDWHLTHIRVTGTHPSLNDVWPFLRDLDGYINPLMNKLIPSHQNANNEQV